LVDYLRQRTILEAVRQVVREELGDSAPRGNRTRSAGLRSQATG
jgi:hypothetical protein